MASQGSCTFCGAKPPDTSTWDALVTPPQATLSSHHHRPHSRYTTTGHTLVTPPHHRPHSRHTTFALISTPKSLELDLKIMPALEEAPPPPDSDTQHPDMCLHPCPLAQST
eukprot:359325-Chlamydomonas_euryale.AAC.3